jgi:hypothetical protein
MMIKAMLFAALIGAASVPLAADPLRPFDQASADATVTLPPVPSGTREPARSEADLLVMYPAPNVPGDVVGGRGPNPHARELREIAIYTDIGNRDGAEILIGQLHQFGVTRQTIQRSIDGMHLHGSAPGAATARQIGNEQRVEAGWETSQ